MSTVTTEDGRTVEIPLALMLTIANKILMTTSMVEQLPEKLLLDLIEGCKLELERREATYH